MEKNGEKKKKEKQLSLIGLFVMIVTGFVKSIPKLWKSILIRSVISFLVVMAFNFYTIAVINEGFGGAGYTFGTFWGDMSNLQGNNAAFSTICFVITYVITMLISQIASKGIKVFGLDVIGIFPWIISCFSEAGKKVGPVMLITMGAMMLIGILTQNEMLFIILIITFFFELVAKEKGLVGSVSMAVWNDFHRVAKRKVKPIPNLNPQYVGVIGFGLFVSSIILYIIPLEKQRFFSIILMIVFITLGVLLALNKINNRTAKTLIIIVLFNIVYLRVTGRVFADDGGWHEGGANPKDYLASAGSKEVIKSGIKPATVAVAGGWLASAVNTITGTVKWGWGFTTAVAEDVGYVVKETAIGVKDLTVDVFTGGELIKETFIGSVTEVGELADDTIGLIKDGAKWVDENVTVENILEAGEGAVDLAGEGIDALVAEGEEFIDDPTKYVEDTVDAGIKLVEDGGTLAGELSVKAEKLLNDMLEAGEDPKKVYEAIKKILPTDNIKNMIDPDSPLAVRLLNAGFAIIDAGQLILTGGAGSAATEVLEQGVKVGIKEAVEIGTKEVIEQGVKEIIEQGTKEVIEQGTKEIIEQGTKEIIEQGTKEIIEQGTKEVIEQGTKEIIEQGTKEIIEQGTKEIIEQGTKEVIEQGTKEIIEQGTKEVIEQGTKEVIEQGTKEVIEQGTKEVIEQGTKEVVEQGTKETLEQGTKEAVEQGAKETAEQGTKEAVEQGVKETAEQGTKEAVEQGAKETVEQGAKETAEQGAKETAEQGAKETAEQGAKETAEQGAKETAEQGAKETAEQGAKETTEQGAKETAEQGAKETAEQGAKETAEQGAKETTEQGTKEGAEQGAKQPQLEQGDNYTRNGEGDTSWMTDNSKKSIQQVSDEMGVQVHVRPGNPASKKWLDAGDAVPKPQIIKSKTISDLDSYIGGPKGKEGLVGYFEPIEANMKNVPEDLHDAVKEQFTKRVKEFDKYAERMADLEKNGIVRVKDGIVSIAVKDPDTGATVFKQVAGDVDLFDVTNFDGTELPQNIKDMAVKKLRGINTSNVEHRDLISWDELDNYRDTYGSKWDSIESEFVGNDFSATAKNNMIDDAAGAEGLVTFNPTERTPTHNTFNK
jgi:hypothetical protein